MCDVVFHCVCKFSALRLEVERLEVTVEADELALVLAAVRFSSLWVSHMSRCAFAQVQLFDAEQRAMNGDNGRFTCYALQICLAFSIFLPVLAMTPKWNDARANGVDCSLASTRRIVRCVLLCGLQS